MIPVSMMMAMTLDGKIATDSQQFADWTSKEDKKIFKEISQAHGVVLMGANTFRTFPGPLPGRLNVVFSDQTDQPELAGVKWVKGDPAAVLLDLEKMGYRSALLGGGSTLNSLFLKQKLIQEIIVTIEPKIFGTGLSLFNQADNVDLKLLAVKKINDNALCLRYQVLYPH